MATFAISMAILFTISSCLVLWHLQRNFYITQYLFFLRYPLLAAAALFAGPLLVRDSLVVGNLFVLDWFGIVLVTGVAGFAASSIVFVFSVIFVQTPARVQLEFFREPALGKQETFFKHIDRRHWLYVLALIAPLCALLVIKTYSAHWEALLGVVGGLALGFMAHHIGVGRLPGLRSGLVGLLADGIQVTWQRLLQVAPLRHLLGTFKDGFLEDGKMMRMHALALAFLAMTLFCYVSGYFVLRLKFLDEQLTTYTPALVFMLLLLTMYTLLLGGLSFYFDKFRIPSLLPLLVFSVASYTLFSRDHYFPLTNSNGDSGTVISASTQPCALTPEVAVTAWRDRHQDTRPPLVLVAASGGGITASLWTARVLTGLSEPSELGEGFARSVALVSSVSGGGIGAAYFVNAFNADPSPIMTQETREKIVEAAGMSSLNQTAYALAYNDLLAVFLPFLVGETSPDRGWALESVWRRYMRPDANFRTWREGVRAGWLPTQIFNATIAETGERLLLTPIDCPTMACSENEARWRARSFPDLKAKGELDVVTAARLSATFPWVSPLARQPGEGGGYHIADGGYYDNFGVTTALEWLSRVQAHRDLPALVSKVILVQIRASSTCVPTPAKNSGWVYATVGPLVTMLNVRTTSQRNSNEAAIVALKALLNQAAPSVAFETVSFELDEDSPLSWHLSGTERARIKKEWDDVAIRSERAKLKCLWETTPERWIDTCHTEPPADLKKPDAAAKVFETAHDANATRAVASIGPRECRDH